MIKIEAIAHKEQRYETTGDWQFRNAGNNLNIFVSDTGDKYYNQLVAIHELVEALLCRHRGIIRETIDKWNVRNEPESVGSPYRDEHKFATLVERLMAHELGIDWETYKTATKIL